MICNSLGVNPIGLIARGTVLEAQAVLSKAAGIIFLPDLKAT